VNERGEGGDEQAHKVGASIADVVLWRRRSTSEGKYKGGRGLSEEGLTWDVPLGCMLEGREEGNREGSKTEI